MEYLSQHIESIIFGTEHPVTFKEIHNCLNEAFETEFKKEDLLEAIEAVKERFSDDAYSFEVVQVSGGYQFMSKGVYHNTIGTYLRQSTKKRLSRAAIETLSIIAYKQPVSKPEMERIRGVSCDYSCQKLLEKELITIVGRSDGPGKPLLYGTTLKFMEYFGINSLDDMPKPKDFREVENTIGEKAPIEEGVEVEKSSPIELNLEGEGDAVKIPTAEELEAMIVEVTEDDVTDTTEENKDTVEETVSGDIENNEGEDNENSEATSNEEQEEVVTIPVDENTTELVAETTEDEMTDSIEVTIESTENINPETIINNDVNSIENNTEISNEGETEIINIPINENTSEEKEPRLSFENIDNIEVNQSEVNETMIPSSDSADEMEFPESTTEGIEDNSEIKNLTIPLVGSVRILEDTTNSENTEEEVAEADPIAHSEEDEGRMPSSSENVTKSTHPIIEAFKNNTFVPQVVRKEETILIQTNRIEQDQDSEETISLSEEDEATNVISTDIILDDENTIPTSVVNNEEE